MADTIKVIAGKIEDVHVPEQVDLIISEPMGYMLLNERMLETFLHAKKFLKPGKLIFLKFETSQKSFERMVQVARCFRLKATCTLHLSRTKRCIWSSVARQISGTYLMNFNWI